MTQFLTIEQVANMLNLHPITIRRHIKAGKLRAVKVGRKVRVKQEDIEVFLKPITTEVELTPRRELFKRVIEHRNQLPPLGISTAELIREARAMEGALYGQ